MKPEDIERMLRGAQFVHLKEEELDAYRDGGLDDITLARANAHLKLCLICEQRLAVLQEEKTALEHGKATTEDIALVRRLLQPLRERLDQAMQEAMKNWRDRFSRRELAWAAATDDEDEREIWNWQSDDGLLQGYAVLDRNGDLTFWFVSKELGLEGERFYLCLGDLRREVVLWRVSETEVGAEVVIPAYERPADPSDISLEME
ncbi:MAG: hypothetical protein ACE5LU_18705 [Anaerolineae bacterium]